MTDASNTMAAMRPAWIEVGNLAWLRVDAIDRHRVVEVEALCTVERINGTNVRVRFGPSWAAKLGGEYLDVKLEQLRRLE